MVDLLEANWLGSLLAGALAAWQLGRRSGGRAAGHASGGCGARPLAVRRHGAGPPVLHLQRLGGSHRCFEALWMNLPPHEVIAADLLGFGHSPKPRRCGYALEDHVEALAPLVPPGALVVGARHEGHKRSGAGGALQGDAAKHSWSTIASPTISMTWESLSWPSTALMTEAPRLPPCGPFLPRARRHGSSSSPETTTWMRAASRWLPARWRRSYRSLPAMALLSRWRPGDTKRCAGNGGLAAVGADDEATARARPVVRALQAVGGPAELHIVVHGRCPASTRPWPPSARLHSPRTPRH